MTFLKNLLLNGNKTNTLLLSSNIGSSSRRFFCVTTKPEKNVTDQTALASIAQVIISRN